MLVIVCLLPLALLALVMGLSVLEDRMDKVIEQGVRPEAEHRRPTVPADG